MALAVCLLFDPRSERLVRELWGRLEAGSIATLATHTHRRHHPHLSYVVLRSWELDRVRETLGALPEQESFELAFHGTVVFPRGRVALAPAVSADIAVRQWRIATALAATGAELHRNYRAGHWVPHVSVATRAQGAALPAVVKAVADALPLTVRVDRAALVDSGTGRTWPLPHLV